jgi:2-C-methyl-D-erythritol 4-phosphate cytidylyltransferase
VDEPIAAAILLGAGVGRRIGADEPKAFLRIGGRPMLAVAAGAAAASPSVTSVVVTAPPGWEDRAAAALDGLGPPVVVVPGGVTRQASVRAALEALPDGIEVVAVHDAARPFASPELFSEVVSAVAAGADGAIPVVPITDTVKRLHDGWIAGTEPREQLALAQTPQGFRTEVLREAHDRAARAGVDLTDDAAVLEWAGFSVLALQGDPTNVKITTLLDLALAEARMGNGSG